MAQMVSLGEVNRGEVDIVQLAKLNSLLDYRAAMQHAQSKKAEKR